MSSKEVFPNKGTKGVMTCLEIKSKGSTPPKKKTCGWESS
jgi:hypothetical protein